MARLPIGKHGRLHRGGPTAGHDPIPHAVELTSGDSSVTVTWTDDHTADLSAATTFSNNVYTSHTPALTADTSNPTGWSSQNSWYFELDNKFVHYYGIFHGSGSPPTFGTGEWMIDLPVQSDPWASGNYGLLNGAVLLTSMFGASQARFLPHVALAGTPDQMKFSYLSAYPSGTLKRFGSVNTAGWTLASGDTLVFDVVYKAS